MQRKDLVVRLPKGLSTLVSIDMCTVLGTDGIKDKPMVSNLKLGYQGSAAAGIIHTLVHSKNDRFTILEFDLDSP